MVSGLTYHPRLRDSDHCCLTFQFNCYTISNDDHKVGFNYNKGDYNKLRQMFEEVDWGDTMTNADVDDARNFSWRHLNAI